MTQKASVLPFMVNNLLQNKAVIGQIDGVIEKQDTARRDCWPVDSGHSNQETEDSAIEETPEFARLVDEFGGCQSRSLGRLYDTRRDDPFGQRKQQKEEAVETEEHPEEAGSEADDSTESPTKATK